MLVLERRDRFDLRALLIRELGKAIGRLSCIGDRDCGIGKTFDARVDFPNFLEGVVDLGDLLDVGEFSLVESFRSRFFGDVVDDLVQRLSRGAV